MHKIGRRYRIGGDRESALGKGGVSGEVVGRPEQVLFHEGHHAGDGSFPLSGILSGEAPGDKAPVSRRASIQGKAPSQGWDCAIDMLQEAFMSLAGNIGNSRANLP